MTEQKREKFTTQVNLETLSAIRTLAKNEGRQLQTLVDEALSDLLKKRKQMRPCSSVMAAYQASHEEFSELYKKLAE